ncbi:MAG: RIP metalloprotease RseP [Deltaproteobacteria bacterium]|nr:MAG: RIP metalloprotease RseP [Deltaproteobacteria bacterium]
MIHILAFLWVLGVLIFIHELGHFLVAKLRGVKVLKFSLGFGPKLISKKMGETEYMISALPLGGYVKLLGDDPGEKVPKQEEARTFRHQPVRRRMAIVIAGPLANLLFAAFIFSTLFFVGIPQLSPVVGKVVDGFPAQQAGVRPGDVVLKVDKERITKWADLLSVIPKSEGRELLLTLRRGEEIIKIKVTPRAVTGKNIFGEKTKTYQIGIVPSGEAMLKREPIHKAVAKGFYQTWHVTKLVVVSIVKIIQRVIPAKTIGGPILIAQMAGKQAKEGLLSLIFFTAVLSINLGILNLFPIPILDGGHLLFLTLESIIGRPLSVKKLELAQQIGLIIIILLMVFAFYNDIMRIIPHGTK